MAFTLNNWDKLSAEGNTNVPRIYAYYSASDAIATIVASAYFNNIDAALTIGDQINIVGSDGAETVRVTAVSPNVTVAADPAPAAGSITNTEINASAAIAYSKLAALTSGNILVGSAGNVATSVALSGDATIVASGAISLANTLLKYATVAITAAEFNGMYAAPKLLVAAPGANKIIVLDKVQLLMTYVAANYASGGVVAVQYDSTANGAGVIASTTLSAATFQAAASTGFNFNAGVVPETFTTCVNKGLYLSNITGAFTTGDSTFVAHVWYKIIPTV